MTGRAVLIALALAAFAQAAEPIAGPATVARDTIAEYSVAAPGEHFVLWDVYPFEAASIREIGQPPVLLFAGKPGAYTLTVRLLDPDTKRTTTHRRRVVVADGSSPDNPPEPDGPNPPPGPPPPGPPPTPKPVRPPAGPLGLAPIVFDAVAPLPQPARAKCPQVAAAFRSLSAAIAAGVLGIGQIPGETRRQFDAATADQAAAWKPADTATQAELRKLAAAGRIKSAQDLAAAYLEIATGIDAAK